jgi:putative endonuclease
MIHYAGLSTSGQVMRWWNKADRNNRTTQELGHDAEQVALYYLNGQGLVHIESNFRRPFGEIDLVMQEHGTLVFVEVRSRSNDEFGGAAASVTKTKLHRMSMIGQVYLQRFQVSPPCRYDVVAIDDGKIEWIKNVVEV